MRCALWWLLAWMDNNYCEAYWEVVRERECFLKLLTELLDDDH